MFIGLRVGVLLIAGLLVGCAATAQQVTSALGDKYSGKSVDRLVMEFGPPMNSFKMADGGSAYQWEVANHTNIATNQYGGSASTHFCRIRAIVGRDNIVQSVSTEDSSNVYGESFCAKRLGLKRES